MSHYELDALGSTWLDVLALAITSRSADPRCEFRALVLPIYPDGIKAYGHQRLTVFVGRRGKPVFKLRFMPMARAHELARHLQRRFG
jgi:hypothetical protein